MNKNIHIFFATLLSATLFLANGMTVQAVFTDKDSTSTWEWAGEHISWAYKNDIVAGKGNNRFDADGSVTRAEAATMMVRFKEIDAEKYDTDCEQFTDVGDAWYTKYINAAYANGLVSGKTESSFDPEGLLTRAEAATLIVSAMEYELATESENEFADIADNWYTDYIHTAFIHEIVSGKSANKFDPNANVSRAEMVTMLHSAMKENFEIGLFHFFHLDNRYTSKFTNDKGQSIYHNGTEYPDYYGPSDASGFGGDLYPDVTLAGIFEIGIIFDDNSEVPKSEYFIFDTIVEDWEKTISFGGSNADVSLRGTGINRVQVYADGTVYLHGTDMEYTIWIENMAYQLEYSDSGADDVILKVVDKQIVEVTE